jgi:nucleotide-binding universal stress UspA family protein
MVQLDGSDLADCVLPDVEAVTSGVGVKKVVLVWVENAIRLPAGVPATGTYGFTEKDRQKMETQRVKDAKDYLAKVAHDLNAAGTDLSCDVTEGRVSESLTEYAVNNNVDLIVMASRGRSGVSRWVMGSVAERMVRHSCVPVLMIRASGCEPKF